MFLLFFFFLLYTKLCMLANKRKLFFSMNVEIRFMQCGWLWKLWKVFLVFLFFCCCCWFQHLVWCLLSWKMRNVLQTVTVLVRYTVECADFVNQCHYHPIVCISVYFNWIVILPVRKWWKTCSCTNYRQNVNWSQNTYTVSRHNNRLMRGSNFKTKRWSRTRIMKMLLDLMECYTFGFGDTRHWKMLFLV